jgi:ADP-ribose pyrophosphatase YjhB (NUDIX family)
VTVSQESGDTPDTGAAPGGAAYADYIAGLPRVLAAAGALFRDTEGRVLLVEPHYRPGWGLPGGTVEADTGESPREGARRETREEIGLDLPLGRLLAVDWSRGPGRPPIVMHLFDGGILTERQLAAIELQEAELLSWRMVPRTRLAAYLPGQLAARVTAALDVLDRGEGAAELVDGVPEAGLEG